MPLLLISAAPKKRPVLISSSFLFYFPKLWFKWLAPVRV